MSFVLAGEAKLYKHSKANTLYVAIPSGLVKDSAFPFKEGERVSVKYDPEKKSIVIGVLQQNQKEKKGRTNTSRIR
jgi:hypothetical protein